MVFQKLKYIIQDNIRQEGLNVGHWYPVGFALGILCGIFLPTPLPEILTILTIINVVTQKRGYLCFFVLSLGFGVVWTHIHAKIRGAGFIERPFFHQSIQGKVVQSQSVMYGQKLVVKLDHPLGKAKNISKIMLWYNQTQSPIYDGSFIKGKAHIFPPPTRKTPQSFDTRWYLFWEGIQASGKLHQLQYVQENNNALTTQIQKRLTKSISQFPNPIAGEIYSKIIQAKGVIPPSLRQSFAASGLSHILAVSGLHMTIVIGLLMVGWRRILVLVVPWRYHHLVKIITSICTLPLLWLYTWQCWSAISARRAMIMSTIGLVAIWLNHPAHRIRTCMVAALFILLTNPEAILSMSFQMSFLAVLVLLHETNKQSWISHPQKSISSLRKLGNLVSLSFKLSFLTSLYATSLPGNQTFGIGVISNLWAIPYLNIAVMPIGFVHYLCTLLGWDLAIMRTLCSYSIGGLISIAAWGEKMTQWFSLTFPMLSPLSLFLLTGSILWGVLWQASWRRWNRWGLALTLISLFFPQSTALNSWDVFYERIIPTSIFK